jgi:hypothetical protein
MEVTKRKSIRLAKIEKLLQPSTRVRKLKDMADGNFTTNHTLLGKKKNGSEHDDRNDRFVFPLGRPPTWVHFIYLTSVIPIRLNHS